MSNIPSTYDYSKSGTDIYETSDYVFTENCASGITGSNLVQLKDWYVRGQRVPNYYRELRKGHLLPFTWFEHISRHMKVHTSVWDYTVPAINCWGSYTSGIRATYDALVSHNDLRGFASHDWHLREPLVQGAAAKCYSRGHDTLTFLLEFKKIIEMFKNIPDRLDKLLGLQDATGAWLEYRYGWRTLMYDLLDIQKAVKNMEKDKGRTRSICRVGTTNHYSDESTLDVNWSSGKHTLVTTDVWSISNRGSIVADIVPSYFQFNPFVSGWELLKYSFIVDWVIGVGRWIEAMSFLAFQTDHTAAYGYKCNHVRTLSLRDVEANPGYTIDRVYFAKCESEIRGRFPSKVSHVPLLDINLDFYKVVDLISIVSGHAKNGRPGEGGIRL